MFNAFTIKLCFVYLGAIILEMETLKNYGKALDKSQVNGNAGKLLTKQDQSVHCGRKQRDNALISQLYQSTIPFPSTYVG